MPFSRFVEIGRVCLVNYGDDAGKLCAIIDVLDQNRVLVSGPAGGLVRQEHTVKRLSLTDLTVKVPRGARVGTLTKAWKKADIDNKWKTSSWGKKLAARETKANMTDFDRFKVMLARKARSQLAGREFAKLKKQARK
eukprot:Rmarinus@m.15285